MSYPPPPGQSPYPSAPPPAGGGYGGPPKHLRGRVPRLLGWIFLVVAVALFVIGGVILGTKSFSKVNGFERVSVSAGSGTVQLDGTGKWIGYYEASNVNSDIKEVPSFQVGITGPNGSAVTLQRYGNRSDGKIKKLTYDYNGHKGVAAFQFTATQKGTYTIRTDETEDLPSGAKIAIGRDIGGATTAGAVLIGLGVLFIIATLVLLIVGYVKRGRHKKELAAYAGGYGGPPPNYPPPGGQSNYPPPGGQSNYPPPGGQSNYPPPGGQPPAGGQQGGWPQSNE